MTKDSDADLIETLEIALEEISEMLSLLRAGGDPGADSEDPAEYLIRIGTALLCEQWHIAGAVDAAAVVRETAAGFGVTPRMMSAAQKQQRREGRNVN